ncbi:MAG TPA: methyltransferase domain-containing protein [Xanthobacteraceae bacterium]|nr:methyltransferase domain-containing protein [Xanthobacteraceae bacterium]
MNRKQRRALGRSGSGPALGPAAGSPAAAPLAELFAAAVARHQAGALAEAERSYRHILSLFPGSAETHSRLGAALMAQGRTKEALASIERALALNPGLFDALGNIAQAYLAVGEVELAVGAAVRVLEMTETEQTEALFVSCAKNARFAAADTAERCRRPMLRALEEGWARPRELTAACVNLSKRNGALNDCAARAAAAWPRRLPAAELFGASGMAALADDRLFCRLLACDPLGDVGLERLLTDVRAAMLAIASDEDQTVNDRDLQFYAAVAQQCFINEYVYALPQAEADQARELQSALVGRIETGAAIAPLWPIAVGAYCPLFTLPHVERLCDRPWPQAVEAVIVEQIKEPAEERRLAATIPDLTGIADEVSRAVRQQYEENPYPRWVLGRAPGPIGRYDAGPPGPVADVLIAGCGTGLSAIALARQLRHARILAIDLSLASLSYAKRMAQNFGLTGIEFAQADILRLGAIGRQFDFIDASGVLHHLADPWQGWRVLLSLLRPGGTMQVGLYSELARPGIVAARALIAERGYRPTADDIRRCRQDIIAAEDPLLKSVVRMADFFTTGECRDLLFHVQEHRIALPDIKSFLAANNLNFAGFILDPSVVQKFAARFPQRAALTDLDCWHAFETEMPDTFVGMYQFQITKPPA